MNLMECAIDAGVTYQTILRWVKAGELPVKRIGKKEIFIDPAEWAEYCLAHNMVRKGEQ